MRGYFFLTLSLLVLFCYNNAIAQNLTVTSGLRLHLKDANSTFTPSVASSNTPALWQDASGSGNHMVGRSVNASPTYQATLNGARFDGVNDMMENQTLNAHFANPNMTMFAVRVANTQGSINGGGNWNTLMTVSRNNYFESEFGLYGNWAIHHTVNGNWTYKIHQCYAQLPDTAPAAISGRFGAAVTDLDYYVNGLQSTEPIQYTNSPATHGVVDRRVYLGGRFNSGGAPFATEFFEGTVLEVLIYDRVLSPAEMDEVHLYLLCKYKIKYAACTKQVNCEDNGNSPIQVFDTVRVGICPGDFFRDPSGYEHRKDTSFNKSFVNGAGDSIVTYYVTVYSRPTIRIDIAARSNPICIFDSVLVRSTGANTYAYYSSKNELLGTGTQFNIIVQNQTDSFWVVGTDTNGCTDTVRFKIDAISCCELFMPNAFTPNHDGNNDVYGPAGSNTSFYDYSFVIYNRWGNRVFSTDNPKTKWDGNYPNGKPADVGVYYWHLKGKCSETVSLDKKGDVSLIR